MTQQHFARLTELENMNKLFPILTVLSFFNQGKAGKAASLAIGCNEYKAEKSQSLISKNRLENCWLKIGFYISIEFGK